MGYPIWQTKAGDLGKISAQQYFDLALEAIDPDGNGTISYSLVAGNLPRGLRIDPTGYVSGNPELVYVLEGVPFSTNVDTNSQFTIRATNTYDNKITDRTFLITITGNFAPQITTVANPLGSFLDGTEVNLQLEAIDLNNDVLTWALIAGNLPAGLSISETGLITGILKPVNYSFSTNLVGWSNSSWNNITWEFGNRSNNTVYNFTVSVTDGKALVTRDYNIKVFAFNDVRADSESITADSTTITADIIPERPPILITKTLGDLATVNSGGYFAFKFDAVDYDTIPLYYRINSGGGGTWDEITNWDMDIWDKSVLALTPGLNLDPVTGWLSGYIPKQAETSITYTFSIYVESSADSTNVSPSRLFSLTVLGNLDLAVNWDTPADLGSISLGAVSNRSVVAVAAGGRELTYSLKNGSRLPQGLILLPDGTLSGRVSFQTMGFDQGTTTFDKQLASRFVYTKNTNFDNVYQFTVIANDYYNQISSEKTFSIRVQPTTYEPYENLYIRCLPSIGDRDTLQVIVNNTDIFDPDSIYRPMDPYYGVQPELRFLVSYGIKASKMSDYIAAMQDRHFNKKFYFGEYKLAQGKDTSGNVLYDVIYVDLIEDTKIYKTVNGINQTLIPAAFTNINNSKARWRNPRASYLPQNQLDSSLTKGTADVTYIRDNDSFYAFEPLNVISPNDLTLMQKDISRNLQNSYLNSLPEWMISVQSDGKILGYTTGAVIAYLKPGTGAKALYNIKRFAPSDIKKIPFVSDRYVLNNSYSNNFDINKRKYVSHKYTTFDQTSKGGNTIVPVARIDYAVNRPFSTINGQTLEYVIETGGLDGVTYNLQDKQLIFATQEAFVGWDPLFNDGWYIRAVPQPGIPYPDIITIIPGYQEKLNVKTLQNRRGGVWKVDIDQNNIVTLIFEREINPGEYVFVNEGSTHANSYQLYDIAALTQGFTVPKYTQSYSSVYQANRETLFDKNATIFINNVETYTLPLQGDKYLKFPKIGVFTNGQ